MSLLLVGNGISVTFFYLENVRILVNTRTNLRLSMEHEIILGVFLTPIILFGFLGNVLSFLVWLRGSQSKTSTAKYLSALAFVDAVVLLFPATELWIFLIRRALIRDLNTLFCKLYTFLPYFGPQMSAWIVVFVTTERAISVWYPHRVKILSTPVKAYLSILILTLCISIINFPLFTDFSLSEVKSEYIENDKGMADLNSENPVDLKDPRNNASPTSHDLLCVPKDDSLTLRFKTFWDFWAQFIFLFSVPFVVICICNMLIVLKVMLRRKYHDVTGSDSPVLRGRNPRLIRPITARIIAVSLVHCISSAPLSILVIDRVRASRRGDYYLLRDIFNVLFYINNGINFILYCVLGTGFRKDLLALLFSVSKRRRISSRLSRV